MRVPRLPGESRIPNLTYAGLGVQPLLNLHGLPGPQNLLLPLGPQSLLGMGVALPGPGGGVRRSLCHREPCPTASRGCGHGPEDTRQETDLGQNVFIQSSTTLTAAGLRGFESHIPIRLLPAYLNRTRD